MLDRLTAAEIVTVVGLLMDAIGIALLFSYAPEKFPHPQTRAFFRIDEDRKLAFEAAQKRRSRIAGSALLMIFAGFVLQIVAVIFW